MILPREWNGEGHNSVAGLFSASRAPFRYILARHFPIFVNIFLGCSHTVCCAPLFGVRLATGRRIFIDRIKSS